MIDYLFSPYCAIIENKGQVLIIAMRESMAGSFRKIKSGENLGYIKGAITYEDIRAV